MSKRKTVLLIWFAVLSAGAILISNLSAIKLWSLAGISVDGGLVLFPLTYILGDLTVEIYGEKLSKTVIFAGFALNIIAVITFYIVIALPPYPGWDMQEAYASVLGFSPRIIFGSLAGFLTSSLLNNFVFEKMRAGKSIFGRSFIARALGSSAFAHILDTAVFETIAFLGVLSFPEFVTQAIFAYILGMGCELILAPLEAFIERKLRNYV